MGEFFPYGRWGRAVKGGESGVGAEGRRGCVERPQGSGRGLCGSSSGVRGACDELPAPLGPHRLLLTSHQAAEQTEDVSVVWDCEVRASDKRSGVGEA